MPSVESISDIPTVNNAGNTRIDQIGNPLAASAAAIPRSPISQPVPLFHNNIWQVPMAVRVMSGATSQWQMFLHSRPHRLVAFSSYTRSLEFVQRVGYWDKDVIPEDSRFYWKAFFTFGERFSVKSVYLPLYGDSPLSRDYASTHMSQYNQIKRWAG